MDSNVKKAALIALQNLRLLDDNEFSSLLSSSENGDIANTLIEAGFFNSPDSSYQDPFDVGFPCPGTFLSVERNVKIYDSNLNISFLNPPHEIDLFVVKHDDVQYETSKSSIANKEEPCYIIDEDSVISFVA
jgi:hypothetical protein